MKKMTWGRISLFVLSVTLLAAACSKPKDGTNGKDGAAGATGATGTANVIYSAWTSVTFTIASDSSAYLATIAAPKLVDSILQKGEIKVYVNTGTTSSPVVYPLPFATSILDYFSAAKISLVGDGNYSTYINSGATYFQYRYILIPGGTAGRSAINWNDYQQVKQWLGLKD